MPELAISYLVGFLVVVSFVTATYFWNQKLHFSQKINVLNENLQKIGKFWSHSEGRVLDGGPQDIEKDFSDWSRAIGQVFGAHAT